MSTASGSRILDRDTKVALVTNVLGELGVNADPNIISVFLPSTAYKDRDVLRFSSRIVAERLGVV